MQKKTINSRLYFMFFFLSFALRRHFIKRKYYFWKKVEDKNEWNNKPWLKGRYKNKWNNKPWEKGRYNYNKWNNKPWEKGRYNYKWNNKPWEKGKHYKRNNKRTFTKMKFKSGLTFILKGKKYILNKIKYIKGKKYVLKKLKIRPDVLFLKSMKSLNIWSLLCFVKKKKELLKLEIYLIIIF